jgi:hypothetical protein
MERLVSVNLMWLYRGGVRKHVQMGLDRIVRRVNVRVVFGENVRGWGGKEIERLASVNLDLPDQPDQTD